MHPQFAGVCSDVTPIAHALNRAQIVECPECLSPVGSVGSLFRGFSGLQCGYLGGFCQRRRLPTVGNL